MNLITDLWCYDIEVNIEKQEIREDEQMWFSGGRARGLAFGSLAQQPITA